MQKLRKYLENPARAYLWATAKGMTRWVPDELHLRLMYRIRVGKSLDLNDPRTFNEKLQWLKLHDRNPLYTKLVDKAEVKLWVAERIGWEHIVPTLGVWDSFDDIDFDELPEQFVLKCTHDSGGLVICRDRATFDMEAARRKISQSLSRNYYWGGREWPYRDVAPRVLAEEYLQPDTSGDLPDYKLFHFSNGRLVALLMTNRFAEAGLTKTFFDESWRPLNIAEGGHPRKPETTVPPHFEEMKRFAHRLAEGPPFVRVDFYESGGKLLFGEMTFYPNSGFECFDPEEWDVEFGSWLELPSGGGWLLVNSTSALWLHVGEEPSRSDAGLTDYKFYCFDGEPRLLYVSQGLENHSTARISFLNLDWTFAPFTREDYAPFEKLPDKPASFNRMLELARTLSEGIPFVRVDFYDVGGESMFSEMTFHPCSGFMPFSPMEWDLRIGDMLSLDGAYGPLGGQDDR